MIELLNVKKVYTSKKHADCVAIKNLSFTLPDVGMVFVLGKSGCGKSTLLNLLGGLDDVTEGKIIVGGNDFSSLSTQDGDSYRCSYAGFVFQDFCLLEGMTVAENVRISLATANGQLLLTDYASCGKEWMDEKRCLMTVWMDLA